MHSWRVAVWACGIAVGLLGCGGSGSGGSALGAGGDAAAPVSAQPTDVPDPCTLLSEASASTLGAHPGLTAHKGDVNGSYDKACVWQNELSDEIALLQIALLYPPSPSDLPTWQSTFLHNEQGAPVTNVGDGAKVDLGTPSHIVFVSGYYHCWLEAYNGDAKVSTLLEDAAREVTAALAKAAP
jgi:hypothetical protein